MIQFECMWCKQEWEFANEKEVRNDSPCGHDEWIRRKE